MFSCRIEHVVRFVLAALVVAPAAMPPAWCHTHTAGHKSHEHNLGGRHAHAHDHDVDELDGLAPAATHVHLDWLGFHATLPAPFVPKHDQDNTGDPAPMIVRLIDASLLLDSNGNSMPNCSVRCSSQVASLPMLVVEHSVERRISRRSSVAPLCDTARHERSGVQLI